MRLQLLDIYFTVTVPKSELPDPNWLYSSVVVSSAAVVAIVGGLITSNVLEMASRRNDLGERLVETEALRKMQVAERGKVAEGLDKMVLDAVFGENLETVVSLEPFPTNLSELQSLVGAAEVSKQSFENRLNSLCNHIRQVESTLDELGIESNLSFEGWAIKFDRVLQKKGILGNWPKEWLARRRYVEKQEGIRDPWPPGLCLEFNQADLITPIPDRDLSTIDPTRDLKLQSSTTIESKTPDELRIQVEILDAQIRELDVRHRLIEERLAESFAPSRPLWIGLGVLAALAVSGIFVPLVLMPESSATYRENSWHKDLVIASFAAGMLAVFIYVGWVIALSSRKPSR